MSGFVFDEGNLNTAALTSPGAYVQLMTPTGLAVPGPSNAIGLLGTASWGPLNQAVGPVGDTGSAAQLFGQFNVSLWQNDQYDLMRAAMQAIGEAQANGSLNVWLSRVSDGTDTAASVVLKDTTTGTALTGITLPAIYTGIGGNTIQAMISAAGPAYTYNVTFVATFGGQTYTETFMNIAGSASGASPFWANLKQAILNGNQSRGPSQLIGTPTIGESDAINPAAGTFSLSGGTDGRSGVTSSSFFGSDVIGNRQGIYALSGLSTVPAYIYCAGMTDNTKFANIQAFCKSQIVRAVLPFPAGTSSTSAASLVSTLGISDKRIMYARNWVYWVDPVSGQTIFTDPVAIMIGRAASLSPQLTPLNKQIYTVVGAEQSQFQSDEIGLLNSSGVWAIANPCIGGSYWGIISATTTSLNPIQQPVEYARLEDYIGLQFASALGQFVGDPQGVYDPDPTRSACKSDIDDMMQDFYEAGLIVDWESQCDASLNTPTSIQGAYMIGNLTYTAFTNVKFVILNLATAASLSAGQALALNQANSSGG